MNELAQNKKRTLKELIEQLHAGTPPQEVKERFKKVLKGVSPMEIAKIEQELIEEGMPRGDPKIMRRSSRSLQRATRETEAGDHP